MNSPTDQERAYLDRIRRASATLEDAAPPESLQEAFARFAALTELHQRMAAGAPDDSGDGDLASHLAFLERLRSLRAPQMR